MLDFSLIEGFDWDTGNATKSERKHGVSQHEAEQVFFNLPLLLLDDIAHSQIESRMQAMGRTDGDRKLHITFTLRSSGTLLRVISAREMSVRERQTYDDQIRKN